MIELKNHVICIELTYKIILFYLPIAVFYFLRYVHRREKNYSCPQCDYKTLFKCDLNKHQKSVHQKIRKVCSFCGKHVANLAEHVRFVHKHAKKHKCENCNYACVKQSDLRKHVAAVHKWSKGLIGVPGAAAAALAAVTGKTGGESIKVEGRWCCTQAEVAEGSCTCKLLTIL